MYIRRISATKRRNPADCGSTTSSAWNVSVHRKRPADAEIIWLAMDLLKTIGITDITLRINSIGCPVCRPVYREKLLTYLHKQGTSPVW